MTAGNITYPADPTMLMCVAHAAGDTFVVKDGELHVTVQSEARTIAAPVGALDELEGRGWVEVMQSGETVLTERGVYWTQRWLAARLGKGVLRRDS